MITSTQTPDGSGGQGVNLFELSVAMIGMVSPWFSPRAGRRRRAGSIGGGARFSDAEVGVGPEHLGELPPSEQAGNRTRLVRRWRLTSPLLLSNAT